jgi:rhodanese-related sulfurtransferase
LSPTSYSGDGGGQDALVRSGIEGGVDQTSGLDVGVPDAPGTGVDVYLDTNSLLTTDVLAPDAPPTGTYADAPLATDWVTSTPDAVAAEAAIRTDAELPGAPDAVGFEAAARMDTADAPSSPDAVEAAKPADAAAFDTAKPPTDLGPATLAELSPKQLHDVLANKDFLLIDVHYPNAGSIPGTDARIAYDDIPALVAFIGPSLDTKVVLTCLSGGMSKSAGNALVALGYRNISELTGGMNAWTKAGYSLVHLDGGL